MSVDAPADRIFLRGYRREVEIGVFAEEYGVTQGLRFDITLELVAGPARDDVVDTVSYDTLVEAVEAVARGPRLQLLESFAERVAERCLAEPRAARVDVRIEKLDRLPGGATLGVEITRRRAGGEG